MFIGEQMTCIKIKKLYEDAKPFTYAHEYDACMDNIDVAIVITNDTDLAEPIKLVADNLGKTVINLCPHKSVAFSLKKIKNVKHYKIETAHLAKSQFPDSVKGIIRPYHWSEEN